VQMLNMEENQEKNIILRERRCNKMKIAIVTGASRGIGREIAKTLAENGANIAINYRKYNEEVEALVEELKSLGVKVLAIKCDVSNEEEVTELEPQPVYVRKGNPEGSVTIQKIFQGYSVGGAPENHSIADIEFKIKDVNYSIHTANPFNWLVVASQIKKSNCDLVMLQWWHPYFAPCYWALGRLLGKRKFLFVCHNVFPHERFPMDRFLARRVLKRGDYFVTQSHMDAKDLLSLKPKAHYVVTPHPTYNAFKLQDMSMAGARGLLGIDEGAKILLFFGFVREYKGLKYLLEAMPQILLPCRWP